MTDAAASSFAASHFTQFNTKAKLPNLTSRAHYIDLLESIMAKSGLRAYSLVTRLHICTGIGAKPVSTNQFLKSKQKFDFSLTLQSSTLPMQ